MLKTETNSFEAEGGDRNCLQALAERFLEEREKVFYIVVRARAAALHSIPKNF